jgi:hypothetical protein
MLNAFSVTPILFFSSTDFNSFPFISGSSEQVYIVDSEKNILLT